MVGVGADHPTLFLMKTCTRCKNTKDVGEFRLHPKHGQPLSWCRQCEAIRRTERRLERQKNDPAYALLEGARRRAARKGITFAIDISDIVVPERCPVLGMEMQRHAGKAAPNSFSLDRVDPAQGYVKGNVAVISMRANALKSDASPEELAAILTKIHGWTCVRPAEETPRTLNQRTFPDVDD